MRDEEFSIDDILSEISDYSDSIENERAEKAAENQIRQTAAEAAPARRAAPAPVKKPAVSRDMPEETPVRQPESRRKAEKVYKEPAESKRATEGKPKSPKTEKRSAAIQPASDIEPDYEKKKEFKRPHGVIRFFLCFVFAALVLVVLCWGTFKLSLDHGSAAATAAANTSADIFTKLDTFVNNSMSDALSDLAFIRKIYTIDSTATVAPAPNPEGFGKLEIGNAAAVLEIIERARTSGLLDGQDVIFDPNANFYWDSDIEYYYDDTILVIAWKELIENRVCSIVEVKLADGSQIRRKLVNDTFGDPAWVYASELAASCNAVIAMNADFYGFRDLGISVYQGQICRYKERTNAPAELDTLYIDSNGDFIVQKRGTYQGREATQQYVTDNDIQFSLAFGPVIVENGEALHVTDGYNGLGEMYLEYSRAAIAQYDKLHYMFMTVNHSNESTPRATIIQFADLVASKGVQTAYNLDGGQTSEIYFQNDMFNHVDWGNERTVSDIIYFATALPEDQR